MSDTGLRWLGLVFVLAGVVAGIWWLCIIGAACYLEEFRRRWEGAGRR